MAADRRKPVPAPDTLAPDTLAPHGGASAGDDDPGRHLRRETQPSESGAIGRKSRLGLGRDFRPIVLERLKRRAEFLAVAANRRKWVAPGLILQMLRHPAPAAGDPAKGPQMSREPATGERPAAEPTTGDAVARGSSAGAPEGGAREGEARGGGAQEGGTRGRVVRYGLTASRKVGGAVVRNRARRRLRAIACAVLPAHARPGHDLVLIARPDTVNRPHADLVADLITGLRRLGVWRERPKSGTGKGTGEEGGAGAEAGAGAPAS